ncbi:MAG: tripartite tricarboxylate transporter substrate-binding protein [Deltaproteobacteria bacterium]|nr:tripartite tricarboxylate transporter substrate-binding protein [Deltaproteobacteria bacterium]
MFLRVALIGFIMAAMATAGGSIAGAASFYENKTVKIVSVSSPGGGYDTYSRLFARHLGKHIPGKPNVIVINIPGGSGLIGTNYVYNITKRDGLALVHPTWTVAQAQFLNFPGIRYDVNKFIWLGLANTSPITVAVRKGSPIQSMEQWLDTKTEPLIFGCTARNSLTCSIPLAMNDIFGKTSKIVPGYKGTAPVRAGLLQKEVDALTGWTWDSVKSTGMSMLEEGSIKLITYISEERHPELEARNVPGLNDKITKPADVAFMKVLLLPAAMVRPWALPPGTPKDRVAVLRKAFDAILKDPAFLADAKRARLDINPRSGEYLTGLIADMKKQMTPEVVSRARRIVGLDK